MALPDSSGASSTLIGAAAGLATSILWTGTSFFFTAASKRLGATAVNASRICVAVVLLALTHRLLTGAWIPSASPRQVAFLAVSGLIGLSIGDQALFRAFLDIGPRLAVLIMVSAPLFAALFGWLFLSEALGPMALLGMAIAVGGIAWVVADRPTRERPVEPWRKFRGVVCALIGAVCQAGGLLLSKKGMGHGWLPSEERLDPQAATLVRMFFALLGMGPILAWHYWRRRNTPAPERSAAVVRAGVLFMAAGAVCGPYLGVWMSLTASDHAPVGVAQTLCSLTPIFMLPVAAIGLREPVSLRACIGAAAAVLGAALLVFRG